jgi:hypothetical protein
MNHVQRPGASEKKGKEMSLYTRSSDRSALARLGVRVAVAGDRGDIRLKRPLFKNTLTQKSRLFEDVRRGSVLDVADRPDSENGWIAEGPANYGCDRFGH